MAQKLVELFTVCATINTNNWGEFGKYIMMGKRVFMLLVIGLQDSCGLPLKCDGIRSPSKPSSISITNHVPPKTYVVLEQLLWT
jgi:hypothetical protein